MTQTRQDAAARAKGRAILPFALLMGVLAAGLALSLHRAELSPSLLQALSTILN